MSTPSEAIARYIEVLVASRDRTTRSEDRSAYTKHLAAAAEMSVAAQRGNHRKLIALVTSEGRNFGWSFLSGDEGALAERAFQDLAKAVASTGG